MFGLPTHLQNTTDAELRQIMEQTIMLQNGTVASQMARSGVRGQMNYGVAITDLRHIAIQWGTNHELARRLCRLDIREARILASMLFDANSLTDDDLELIFSSIINIDMAESFAQNIVGKIADCDFYNRLANGDKWHLLAAIHGVGWAALRGCGTELATWFIAHIEQFADKAFPETMQPLQTTMVGVAKTSVANRLAVAAVAKKLKESPSAFSQTLAKQYLWLASDAAD